MQVSDFPALQVFLPLLAAPVCVIVSRFGRTAWIISMAVTWCVAAMSLSTFASVLAKGKPMVYYMGGWVPPIGIELRIDLMSASMLVLISGLAAIMMPHFFHALTHDVAREKQPYFYSAFLLFLSGLLGIVSTNDAFNLYVFFELAALSSYILIAMGKDRRSFSAAFQYLILGTIGATFILIGIGFLYLMTGSLNISDLAQRIPELGYTRPLLAAFAFITIGLCMKVALFPLHGWLPNAYTHAPSPASSFFAAVGTKVAIYALLRFIYTLFGYTFSFSGMHLALVFTALSVPAILIGSVVAIFETNLKRMLAFSSIAQIGFITLGIGLGSSLGLTAALLHLVNHSVIKGALFLALGCFAYRLGGNATVDNIRGIGRKMPYTSFAFVIAGLGLIGVPLTGGFVSKFHLMIASLQDGWWIVTAVIAVSSFLTLIYIWRIVEALYFGRVRDDQEIIEAPLSMLLPLWALIALTVLLGFESAYVTQVARDISAGLMPPPEMTEPFSMEPL